MSLLLMESAHFEEVMGGLEERLDYIVETLHRSGYNEFYIYETNQLLDECARCLRAMVSAVGEGPQEKELH